MNSQQSLSSQQCIMVLDDDFDLSQLVKQILHVDSVVSATRLTNNAISTNMGLASTVLQQTKDNSKEFSRLGVNAARVLNETSKDIANSSLSQLESAESRQRR